MKRLLIIVAAFVVAVSVGAAEVREREVLLSEDGVLYTVDAIRDPAVSDGRSQFYLTLTIQNDQERSTEAVPATLIGGAHLSPALAYDSGSKTLFLFWQEQLYRGISSRLLFASYRDGRWSDVSTLDSVDWKLRRNLRIAVTRTIEATDPEHGRIQVPQVVVHAVWWEETGHGEWARYAMLGIDNGVVTSTDFRYLLEFAGRKIDKNGQMTTTANEVLRHPGVATTPGRDSVDVVFGDASTDSLHRVRIKPALDGRVRIPIGVRGTPLRDVQLNVAADSRASIMIDEERVAIYTVNPKKLDYVVYRDGRWSSQRSITLNEELSAHDAVDALRRMVVAH